MPDPKTAVRCLVKRHNLSEAEIVERLAELGVKTSQPTINRIKRGKGRPGYEVCAGVIRLHEMLHVQQAG